MAASLAPLSTTTTDPHDTDTDADTDGNWHAFMSELAQDVLGARVGHAFQAGSRSPDVVDSGSEPDPWFGMEHLVEACGERLMALCRSDADDDSDGDDDNDDNDGDESGGSSDEKGSSDGNGGGTVTTTTTNRDEGERNDAAPTVDVMELLWSCFRAKQWQGEARGNFRGLLDAFERFEGGERRRVADLRKNASGVE
ncbi:hypothetical protein SLS58_002927 [Diplodia intermedia]|uniref:Uncharacterized protein n=1 Tax=Diplodia intermedia TaxID=856260 RepID=A0ABR3TYC3_9PEZI